MCVTADDEARREGTGVTGQEAGPSGYTDSTISTDSSRNMVIYTCTCICIKVLHPLAIVKVSQCSS